MTTPCSGKVTGLLVLLLSIAGCSTAWGCIAPTRPEADAKYATIVLAEVIGVRLTDYAAARQRQIRDGSASAWDSDASPGYEVEVLPIEVLKGSAADRLTLRIPTGCAIDGADLNVFGIFYVNARGEALPVYQDDQEYLQRLTALDSQHAAPCGTDRERSFPGPCWKPRQWFFECLSLIEAAAQSDRSSCPSGVQELRDQLHFMLLEPYGWPLRR